MPLSLPILPLAIFKFIYRMRFVFRAYKQLFNFSIILKLDSIVDLHSLSCVCSIVLQQDVSLYFCIMNVLLVRFSVQAFLNIIFIE